MSRKPSKPETRIEDYLDVMTGGNAALPQPILRIEFYYAFLAGMAVELPQPILDDEKLLAKICGMEVEAPTYIPGISPRLYAYMAKKGGQDVQVPDPILRLECYWYDYSAVSPSSVQEYTGAVPVTFVADGTPLLDYIISGNTVQSGTPTPDSPIMPQGTGERTGNLWDEEYPNISGTIRYVPIYVGEGSFTLSTTTPYDSSVANLFLLSGNVSAGVSTSRNGAWLKHNVTAQSDGGYITVAYRHYTGTTSPAECKTMLNAGSTPLPYEPYGYKIPISSGDVTTNIYLGSTQSTRQIKKLVLTGGTDEEYVYDPPYTRFYFVISNMLVIGVRLTQLYCTHYQNISDGRPIGDVPNNSIYTGGGIDADKVFIKTTDYTSVAGFKAYLAQQYANGTPVTIWYVLAEPETGIVNEPLMKIGDYADTLSMEQAGVSIPTANGSTTLDVETAVKPSEVYIKYRGEAVGTLSALPAEVSSPEEIPENANPEETEEEENER